ncbi:formamidopyrimidine-DNA glycosylase [candidate division KSB1 bacterium]|nr:formamidopyrimidine-DNA glycosylase [candidate division KSB1 bacterium]RQW09110.1 MAG: formamidopyrimidine-DNA glycosylase [candidate division KSB1 bacterium]
MPEYPDITIYIERLNEFITGQTVERIRLLSPFFLRTVEPPITQVEGLKVKGLQRIGKRIIFRLANELYLVLHLMVAGRLHWNEKGAAVNRKIGLAAVDFPHGTLTITEAGTKKRASLHVVRGEEYLAEFDRGGLNVLVATLGEFSERLRGENHTLKRALTDPRLFDGIGNAYSDEILHHARLSPVKLSQKLSDAEIARLYDSCRSQLQEWTERLRRETGSGFPKKVTAFRADMAVHGKYGQSCPVCGTAVQRIRYADNETNYCPRCQTDGKLLSDRSLARLLKGDWPKTIEELENRPK